MFLCFFFFWLLNNNSTSTVITSIERVKTTVPCRSTNSSTHSTISTLDSKPNIPVYTGLKSLLRTNLNFSEWIPSGKRFVAGLARGCFLFLDISSYISRHHKRRLLNDLIPNNETHTKHSWIWWKPSFYLRFAMATSPLYIVHISQLCCNLSRMLNLRFLIVLLFLFCC